MANLKGLVFSSMLAILMVGIMKLFVNEYGWDLLNKLSYILRYTRIN